MKKLSFALLTALLILSIQNTCLAQGTQPASNKSASSTPATGNQVNGVRLSEQLLVAFGAIFSGISDASWCPADKGFMARFTKDSILHFAYFTKKGRLQGLIRYYHEEDLPAAIGQQIKDAYRFCSISSVTEVTHGGKTAYLVRVDSGSAWQVIRYVDGETEIWESYQKG